MCNAYNLRHRGKLLGAGGELLVDPGVRKLRGCPGSQNFMRSGNYCCDLGLA